MDVIRAIAALSILLIAAVMPNLVLYYFVWRDADPLTWAPPL